MNRRWKPTVDLVLRTSQPPAIEISQRIGRRTRPAIVVLSIEEAAKVRDHLTDRLREAEAFGDRD